MDREHFEARCREMVGIVLAQVRYYECYYEDGEQFWNKDSRFDSLDQGLDLISRDGRIYGITWDNEFFPYGVTVMDYSMDDFLSYKNVVDVTHSSRWSDLLGHQIVDVKIIWSWVQYWGTEEKIFLPQDLVICFDSGQQVFISAFEFTDGKHFNHEMDHITVFFDENVANTFQVGIDFETS